MTTSQFVYINRDIKNEGSNDSYKIDLGIEINRIPNKTIQLTSATVEAGSEFSFIMIRTDLEPVNYHSSDNMGPCLGILQYSSNLTATSLYIDSGCEQPKYVINNTNSFNIYFNTGGYQTDPDDPTQLPVIDIANFSLIFKISYPEPGEINKQYTNEIQRPGLRPYL